VIVAAVITSFLVVIATIGPAVTVVTLIRSTVGCLLPLYFCYLPKEL
jgi:ABC-type phosphate/phosphonate transport system permease subunit